MLKEKFIVITKVFFIRKSISKIKLKKCINYVFNQTNISKKKLVSFYKKNSYKIFKISKNISLRDIDIVVKTKLNKDYKFIDINKSLIFYEYKKNEKQNEFYQKLSYLNKIKFFPKTLKSNDVIFQKLTLGNYLLPNKISDMGTNILKIVAKSIQILSKKKKQKIKFSSYMKRLNLSISRDSLNSKIIKKLFRLANNYKKENIIISLTHGDFKFEHLFTLDEGRMGVVVSFIAILELVKQHMIQIVQTEPYSPIHVATTD